MSGQEETDIRTAEKMRQSILSVAIESWRLKTALTQLISRLDAQEQNRYTSKLRWFAKTAKQALDSAGFSAVDYEGTPYDSGIPATPVNLDDFPPDTPLTVAQTLEPTILDTQGNIVRAGSILLRENQNI